MEENLKQNKKQLDEISESFERFHAIQFLGNGGLLYQAISKTTTVRDKTFITEDLPQIPFPPPPKKKERRI